MADSDALRQRRRKAHLQGDHSLCRRCEVARGRAEKGGYSAGGLTVSELPPPPASISVAAAEVTDARAELRQLAARMAAAHREDPSNAILGAELRKTLLELMPKGKTEADADLTGLFGALQA